ncbi:sigma-70 family RNA polymerase sigma factor [Nocardioides sp.]|uniref:sigma-70 family RNA polymerase sigma factor n=1 Tax=Nocardioides sp. TaxID=35761 RepID=UPI002BC07F06|nr:sigma-70 family RNA polymerase sigma factor [Nocardioides sp.]HXH78525.1 sigma-70 family RNA polymerase sigma factor [Nocardioides sp.]
MESFEQHRGHLTAVATRILGPGGDAEDAVQETWLRFERADTADVENLRGWLTTVVSRICLDQLRSRTARREDLVDHHLERPTEDPTPEDDAVLAEAVGSAMQTVLDELTPPERVAFVLHDLFAVSFDEIAALLDRSPAATRQLASRARRRIRGTTPATAPGREVVDAFLRAARAGELDTLIALLDPDVVLRADATTAAMGPAPLLIGPQDVANRFNGGAQSAKLMIVDGIAGAAWMHRGEARVVFDFTVIDGRIVAIDLLADPEVLAGLVLEPA